MASVVLVGITTNDWVPNRKQAKIGRITYAKTIDIRNENGEIDSAHGKGIAKPENKRMKAKTLLLAGAIMAAATFGTTAQTVFSVNAVGFVNKTFNAGFSLASNPLVAADNTVVALFDSAPAGTQIFKFNPATGGFNSSTKTIFGWTDPTLALVPGEAYFLKNIGGTPFNITFVGNVNQGSLSNTLVAGFNMVSSQVPQSGLIATDLGAPIASGEQVFRFNGTGYTTSTLTIFGWTPSEPIVEVGEGFFLRKTQAGSWTRQFSVNN